MAAPSKNQRRSDTTRKRKRAVAANNVATVYLLVPTGKRSIATFSHTERMQFFHNICLAINKSASRLDIYGDEKSALQHADAQHNTMIQAFIPHAAITEINKASGQIYLAEGTISACNLNAARSIGSELYFYNHEALHNSLVALYNSEIVTYYLSIPANHKPIDKYKDKELHTFIEKMCKDIGKKKKVEFYLSEQDALLAHTLRGTENRIIVEVYGIKDHHYGIEKNRFVKPFHVFSVRSLNTGYTKMNHAALLTSLTECFKAAEEKITPLRTQSK